MTSPIKPPQEIVSTITKIAPKIYDMTVVSTSEEGSAALISRNAKAGQFVMIRADEEGERIPLTIAQTEAKKRAVRLIFQVVGTSTHKLSLLKPGDQVLNLAGPLGKPSEVVEGKKVLVIGGGVGIAAILPIAGSLYHAGNDVTVVLGARTRDLLILKDEFKPIAHRLVLCTDDGSEGRKGFVTDAMNDLVTNTGAYDVGWAVGPTIMMKMCSEIAKRLDFPLWTSLNPIMVDGTGMCGGCRVLVGNEMFFACVDGPEFDGRLVDWDNLLLRQKQFKTEEADSFHHCRLENQLHSR